VSSVKRVIHHFNLTHELKQSKKRLGRKRKYDRVTAQVVEDMINRKPSIYLDEIQRELSRDHGVHLSLSTIYRLCIRRNLTYKVLHSLALERNEADRIAYRIEMSVYVPSQLVIYYFY
jgi:transposase